MIENMTVGFLFSPSLNNVYLLKKNKPKWQKGLWNGIGGKNKKGETFRAAFIREAKEEVGLELENRMLYNIGVINGPDVRVRIFAYHLRFREIPKQKENEILTSYSMVEIPKLPTIKNLQLIIPYCRYYLWSILHGDDYIYSSLILKYT